MNILGALKKKHEKQKRKEMQTLVERKQLNTTVSPRIIGKVRKLAAEFSVPRYAITEHLLETGHFYVSRILKNRRKRDILREHLIDRHLLDIGYDDHEELLRIGEGRYSSELISLAKIVTVDFRVLERLWADAKRTSNTNTIENAERARKKLLKSVINFANWLSTHPLEEPDKEESYDEEENS